MKKYDVVAIGELLIDLVQTGTSSQGNPLLEANPGGAPCNVLSMLNRLGHKTAFIGKVGRDSFGDQLEAALLEVGIETKGLSRDEEVPTTLAIVHTLQGGDRSFSFYRNPGADVMLTEKEVDYSLIDECKIFHFGALSFTSEPCKSASRAAIRHAKEAGCLLSFDPNLRESLWKSLDDARREIEYGLSQCDILKISDNEIQWLSGKEDCVEGIFWLLERYQIPLVFLSMGKDGSLVFQKGAYVEAPAFVMEDTIETTGAGDTFFGGVLHYILEKGFRDYTEEELGEMLRFANAAAAIVTTRRGALRVMPTYEEVVRLMESRA